MIKNFKIINSIPINLLLLILGIIFIFQTGLIMFYSNGVITFSNKFSFYSIERAANFADTNFTSMKFDINYKKEINGFLYPFFLSFLYKVVGKNNIVSLIYVIIFIIFFIISAIFYNVALKFFDRETAIFSTIFFMTSMPVIISMYSGTDVIFTFLLLALNIYFLIFDIEKKEYKGALITSFLLFFCSLTAAIFGFASLLYIALKFFQKKIEKSYNKIMPIIFIVYMILCVIFLFFIFNEKQIIKNNPLFETKTFFVDTFFKDGFFWSKIFAPFVGLFFYAGLFVKVFSDVKKKEITFNIYSLLLTFAALLMEFFAMFSGDTETNFYISPFYFIFVLYAGYGLFYFSSIIIKVKNINKNLLFTGLFLFIILYNIILSFNKTIEQNNNIRFIANEYYIQKFMEK